VNETNPADADQQPDYIGRYEIVSLLGKGATGAVYLALDPFNDQRKVAIKVAFPEALKNPEDGSFYKSMFLNEAGLAGKVIHPHIVSIFDAVVEDRSTYIVMEYVQGTTLEPYCKPDSLLPVMSVAEMTFKSVRAFAFAHAEGLIHRDIKPANILHTGGTDIKIVDFGAAINKLNADKTMVGNVGSPAYMAPELITGEATATQQSDIYALGVTMYYLLAGRLPFSGTNQASLMYSIVNGDIEPPSVHREGVSAAVDSIVMQAIAKQRSDRYQTWEQFGRDLSNLWKEDRQPEHAKRQMSDAQRFNVMRSLAFFKDFPENELWEAIRISRWASFAPDTQFIREGDMGDSFFIIAIGSVKVTRSRKLLNILGAGECFGEMSYLSTRNAPRSASVTATTDVVVMKIRAADLREASDTCRRLFDHRFMEALVERLQLANEQLSLLAT
jgi:eukaryotic-like serine/threonine-protein kinase